MDTADSGDSDSCFSKSCGKKIFSADYGVPVPIGTEGTVSGSQLSEVQSAAGGRKKLSVVPHRK